MEIIFNNKTFQTKIVDGNTDIIFITCHGLQSNKTSFRYFEKWLDKRATVINFDIRTNGDDKKRATRMQSTYTRDLRDVVLWAKSKYMGSKIVLLGSSWGASLVLNFMKSHSSLVYKCIAWSIPHNIFSSEEAKNNNKVAKTKDKDLEVTSNFGFAWRIILMVLFNINFKSYTKIDLDRTANNKALKRLNSMQKPKATPVKLFYSTWKSIVWSWHSMKMINKKLQRSTLYIQSSIDSYATRDKLDFIRQHTGKGIKYIELAKGKHAFQWELEDDLYIEVFEMVWDFINQ